MLNRLVQYIFDVFPYVLESLGVVFLGVIIYLLLELVNNE